MNKTAAIFLFFVLISCLNKNTETINDAEKNNSNQSIMINTVADNTTDSINYFEVDDYPLDIEMLKDKTSTNSTYIKKVDEVYSLDQAWFTNDILKQTLVFELYTDFHRLKIYHFLNDEIPKSLIHNLPFSIAEGKFKNIFKSATNKQKENSFNGFIIESEKIAEKYFTTNKGIKLGESKEKLSKLYGDPDNIKKEGIYEILEWNFKGEYNLTGDFAAENSTKINNEMIAKNSFGHTIKSYCRENTVIAIIFENDIP